MNVVLHDILLSVPLLAQTNDTPDTQNYLILGYAIGFAILFVIVLSIWWRFRSLAADVQALEQLEAEIKADEAARTEAKAAAQNEVVEAAR